MKINVLGRLLVNLNLLVALDSNGLRDKISPLVGLEYAFWYSTRLSRLSSPTVA